MKYWKSLSAMIAHIAKVLPEWEEMFLSYKDLKKQLKLIFPNPKEGESSCRPSKRPRLEDGGDQPEVAKEVTDFETLLRKEIHKLNSFFMDQEEEYVINLELLKGRVKKANGSYVKLMNIGSEIVDLHGQMVLLENYSALNYLGIVKILKKYDKRSGALLRLPFIQTVLEEPFFNTDVLKQLVKDCEILLRNNLKTTMTKSEERQQPLRVPQELSEIDIMGNTYMALANSALQVLEQIRSVSSTKSMYSLPPLQGNNLDKFWKNHSVTGPA
ncbi:SPX domain-containing protein 1-like [Ipomoea triloba]|uniref:SPX domain-containing protein 1-like n=1 Tax=Ipomoea triloba TaxID=35885 RepID=UPI00125E278D|nr:SPX domain-containing protein 1-like [Ipomoea triloba]